MNAVIRSFARVLLVLWAGSLWSVGLWVTPILFHVQADRHMAGLLAGRIFTVETFVGLGVAALAALLPGRARFAWGYFAAAVLALNEWGLRPVMVAAGTHGTAWGLTFGAWHGVSAVLYLLACMALVLLVWKQEIR